MAEAGRKGRIYISGTYVIKHVQNHYPPELGEPQSAWVMLQINSDRHEGDVSTAVVRFRNQCLRRYGELWYEDVPLPAVDSTDGRETLYVPQPMASLSVWLHILKDIAPQSYYIDYGLTEEKSWAFLQPVAYTHHHVGAG